MRLTSRLAAHLALSLGLAAPIGLASLPAAADTLAEIKERGSILIGVREDAKPFSYIDGEGMAKGYSVALCEAMVQHLATQLEMPKIEIEYKLVTADDRFLQIANDQIDLECGATTYSLSRLGEVDFSLLTFATASDLLVRAGEAVQGIPDLAGRKVGVVGGTTSESNITKILQAAGVTAEVVPLPSHADLLASLETGEIDAGFGDRALMLAAVGRALDPRGLVLAGNRYSYEPYALPLPAGDTAFRQAVDRALARLYGTALIKQIYEDHFGPLSHDPEMAALYRLLSLPE